MKKAIEEYFPIVEINKLAVPERNAFKPIYTMHKWFARRSSSVFRAILLAAMKPAGTDIMEEFYKDHTNDPDTNGKIVLDPFMGGGTTIVEALRLGSKVIGIDLNPVAWFIVKTEVEPVDLDELQKSFGRLAERTVSWSGKPLKETLLDMYKTECPSCGNKNADTIYTFWVKLAPCTTAVCNHQTPLFKDYIIAQKSPSIKYYKDCECPECKKTFDWEIEPASLVGDEKLMINSTQHSAGKGRGNVRWIYGQEKNKVECPWCSKTITPIVPRKKKDKKKIDLSVLYCPHCEEVWQYRGELKEADEVTCPSCNSSYNPYEANIPFKGKYICRGTCNGNVDKIISAIRQLPEDELLPLRPYAIEGYCETCAGKNDTENIETKFFEMEDEAESTTFQKSLLSKNNGKFFKRFSAADLANYQKAKEIWEKEKDNLPYPKSEIPVGAETRRLNEHHYKYWHQMFNERQLLGLSTLLNAICEEDNQILKEMLLSAFFVASESYNMFTRYNFGGDKSEGVFARHDFQPKITSLEGNLWGTKYGKNSFINCSEKTFEAKSFSYEPYDRKIIADSNRTELFPSNEKINPAIDQKKLLTQNASSYSVKEKVDFIITDPPYAGNVNYSELADFFYVWLRLALKDKYPQFLPEVTPKSEEIVENKTRGKSSDDFKEGLKNVFHQCKLNSKDDAPLIFTFHHSEDTAWDALLNAVCEAGYYIEAVYPIHGEAENSLHLMNNEAISYDLIHVCKKRINGSGISKRSWAGVRLEIRQRAREEIKLIESGKYGKEKLLPTDINIILIGKCLELYSKHYGAIVDHEEKPVPIKEALGDIRMMIDQLLTKDNPLPPELENIDKPSYVYFSTLCFKKEIKVDEVHKNCKGIIEPKILRERGLLIKGRETRGRTFEVKQPLERLNDLRNKFKNGSSNSQPTLFVDEQIILPKDHLLVDVVHFLLGLAEAGENIFPWLEKFSGLKPQIRAALEHLMECNKVFISPAKKVLGLIDERTLFTEINKPSQKED